MQLRDYMYLDLKRLEDYLSILDRGELRELREIVREEESANEVPMPRLGKSSDPSQPKRESTTERILSVSAKHSFNQLYEKLSGSLIDVDNNDTSDAIKRGVAVEAIRSFEPSLVARIIDAFLDHMRIMKTIAPKDKEAKQAFALLSSFFQGGVDKERDVSIVSYSTDTAYSIVFLAERKYLLRSPDEFNDEMTLVGKVRRIIPSDQDLDLLAFSNVLPRHMTATAADSREMLDDMMEGFGGWREVFGPRPDRDALVMKGPAIIIDPLAVFI
jgi:hypothetical protein